MAFLFGSKPSPSSAELEMDASAQHQIRTPEEAGRFPVPDKSITRSNVVLPVARIAYLSSDVIVSVQPAIGADSDFSSHLKRYAGRKDRGLVAQGADAVPEVRRNSSLCTICLDLGEGL